MHRVSVVSFRINIGPYSMNKTKTVHIQRCQGIAKFCCTERERKVKQQ